MVWPDTASDWQYVDRAPDPTSEAIAKRVFRNLVALDSEGPMRFRFSPDAQELFIKWLAKLEARVRGEELHPILVSHLSKYRKLMPALALLFELADWAAAGPGGERGDTGPDQCLRISMGHARQAVAWCDYLESHVRRTYSCVTTPQMRAAQLLAEKLKKRQIAPGGFFSCREVYLKGWSGLDTPELVRMAVEVLQDAEWIRDVDREAGPSGGRGCREDPRADTSSRPASRSSTVKRVWWPALSTFRSTHSGTLASPDGQLTWTRTRWRTSPGTPALLPPGAMFTRTWKRAARRWSAHTRHRVGTILGTVTKRRIRRRGQNIP